MATGSTLSGNTIIVDPGCSDLQVLQYSESSGQWSCVDFSSALDFDEDGNLAWEDCNDNDATTVNDMDCDGVLTDEDCDDTDENNTASSPIGAGEDCAGTSL